MDSAANQPRPVLLDRLDAILAASLGLISFAFYARTLLPGLLPNDSAEFQVLAYTLDHAHTTGYSVYLVLAKLFTLLSAGEIAYRVNLFSAFMGGVTVGLVCLAGRTLSGSRWGGVLGAAGLALSATFWSQAIIAEVYTPGSAFTAAILLLVLEWQQTRRHSRLFWAGVLGGLGLGVHGSVILLAPAAAVSLLLYPRGLAKNWKPALAGLLIGLGLLLAAFTMVDINPSSASMMNTYTASISRWGMTPDQVDSFWGRFAFLIFAQQWRSAMFADPFSVMPSNLAAFVHFFGQDFSLLVRLLAAAGLVSLLIRSRRAGLFILSAILFHALYTLNYRIGDIYVFFVSFYVYIAVLAAEGMALTLRLLKKMPLRRALIAQMAAGLGIVVLSLAPLCPARIEFLREGQAHWEFMGLPQLAELEDWHDMIGFNVSALPENAVVLMGWKDLYGYTYTAHVEKGRSDLLFLEAYPYANKQGMADSLFDYLKDRLSEGRPVLALERLDELQRGGFRLEEIPVGVTRMYLVKIR